MRLGFRLRERFALLREAASAVMDVASKTEKQMICLREQDPNVREFSKLRFNCTAGLC